MTNPIPPLGIAPKPMGLAAPAEPFKGTAAVDSLGEFSRLTFAKDMGRSRWDVEDIRGVNNYSGAGERVAMILRRMKEIRDLYKVNIVFTAHEGIDKIFAKGGMIGKKGESPQEPIGVWGRPDIPGQSATQEILRAFDNIFRVRFNGSKLVWVAQREALGGGGNTWEVKDRFNALAINNGYLPPSYTEIEKLALANPACNWNPPYLWLIYGPPGFEKTRSLRTFPPPLELFDIDGGGSVLAKEEKEGKVKIRRYEPDDEKEYNRFVSEFFGMFVQPNELAIVRKALGFK